MFIGLFDRASGALVLDLSRHGSGGLCATNEHGFATFTITVRRNLLTQAQWLDWPGALEVLATWNGVVVWQGRVEDVTVVGDEIRLMALGYQKALSDAPYTALWSTRAVSAWFPMDDRMVALSHPDRFQMDTNNRLYITPVKGSVQGNTTIGKIGRLGFAIPHRSERTIVRVTFNYEFLAPTNWRGILQSWASVTWPMGSGLWATPTTEWTVNGNGAVQTGSAALAVTAAQGLNFRLDYNAADATYTPETGDNYLKITNLRVLTTASAVLPGNEIAGALATFVNALNPDQMDSGNALLESQGLDLPDEMYLDEYPNEIFNRLILLGDNQTPPRRWEWGVYENRQLHLRPRGSAGRAWFVDASHTEIQRTLETLANSVYTIYQDEANETLRTAAASTADSALRYGLTRRAAVQDQTTSATSAGVVRDTALADGATPRPRSAITFDALYDANGTRWPAWMCRSGDTITSRNFPAGVSAEIDRARTFVVSETRYHCDDDRIEVVPESPLPRLEVLLARRAAHVRAQVDMRGGRD